MQPPLQWKAISVTHSKSVFVVLGAQLVMRTCHIVVGGPSSSTIFFHIFSQKVRFKKILNIKCVFDFLYNFKTFLIL
jgi:hypothetical protein